MSQENASREEFEELKRATRSSLGTMLAVVRTMDKRLELNARTLENIVETQENWTDVLREVRDLVSIAGRSEQSNAEPDREVLLISLAHEIYTPLQASLASLANLVAETSDDDNLNRMSLHCLNQIQRLHLVTESILALQSGGMHRSFSVHNLRELVSGSIELFAEEALEKGCRFVVEEGGGSEFPAIEMSLFDLEMAFKNLLQNAVKYSYGRRRKDGEGCYIVIRGQPVDDEHYQVSIQNYGVGISEEEIRTRSIFLAGYRGKNALDRRRTGAGLGLAHARQVVEDQHHGRIEVRSEIQNREYGGDGHLVTVSVILPLRQPETTHLGQQMQVGTDGVD